METQENQLDGKGRVWVTEKEVSLLMSGAKKTKYPLRNELLVLMLYRHGLRASELCSLRLLNLDFDNARVFIKRVKGGVDFTHPIAGDELRLIRRYLQERKKGRGASLSWLFVSERGNQLSRFTVIKTIEVCYKQAGMRKINPHMLRHGCGFYLANKGYDIRLIKDYLGHKNIENTVIYTRLSGKQFEGLWD